MSLNFTLQNHSPFIHYTPTPHADGSNGWAPWYSNSKSYRVTSVNATMNLQFWGTGFSLYGTTNSPYSVTLDNILLDVLDSRSTDVLFTKTGLTPATHYVSLSALPSEASQKLAFERAVVISPSGDTPPIPVVSSNMNETAMKYSSGWDIGSGEGIPNKTISLPYHQTKVKGSTVFMSLPLGAIAFVCNGMSDWENSVYSVALDGVENLRNGSTFWQGDTVLFFQAGLDPTKTHTLNLTNVSDGMNFALNSITVYYESSSSAPTTSSSSRLLPSSLTSSDVTLHKSRLNIWTIVGPIAGAVVVVLGLLLFWCQRRRKRLPPGINVVQGTKLNSNVLLDQAKRQTYHDLTSPSRSSFNMSDPFNNHQSPLARVRTGPAASVHSETSTTRLHDGTVLMTWSGKVGATPVPREPRSRNHSPSTSQSDLSIITTANSASTPRPPLPSLPPSSTHSHSTHYSDNKRALQLMNASDAPIADGSNINSANVETILQIIAARMDPGPARREVGEDVSSPPPEYRG